MADQTGARGVRDDQRDGEEDERDAAGEESGVQSVPAPVEGEAKSEERPVHHQPELGSHEDEGRAHQLGQEDGAAGGRMIDVPHAHRGPENDPAVSEREREEDEGGDEAVHDPMEIRDDGRGHHARAE